MISTGMALNFTPPYYLLQQLRTKNNSVAKPFPLKTQDHHVYPVMYNVVLLLASQVRWLVVRNSVFISELLGGKIHPKFLDSSPKILINHTFNHPLNLLVASQ